MRRGLIVRNYMGKTRRSRKSIPLAGVGMSNTGPVCVISGPSRNGNKYLARIEKIKKHVSAHAITGMI
jgi:hypothetical protein